ncbi:MAG: hypothetical protein IK118_01830 [Clostridia bacterium]|nr:hypothetical protein [Clostridia bacterium]MBR5427062.1 hypothetical protein [Clostridia bacterium]
MNEHKCPVCGKYSFPYIDSYDICTNCGWQDDSYQEEDPDETCCANQMSLNQARKVYAAGLTKLLFDNDLYPGDKYLSRIS